MDGVLMRSLVVEGVGLVILLALLVRLLICILCKSKLKWQTGQVHSVDSTLAIPLDVEKGGATAQEIDKLGLESRNLDVTAASQVIKIPYQSSTIATTPTGVVKATGDYEQIDLHTPALTTFYKAYTGVAPHSTLRFL